MNRTLLTPCCVPWMVGPSTSAVTLKHMETDTEPECLALDECATTKISRARRPSGV